MLQNRKIAELGRSMLVRYRPDIDPTLNIVVRRSVCVICTWLRQAYHFFIESQMLHRMRLRAAHVTQRPFLFVGSLQHNRMVLGVSGSPSREVMGPSSVPFPFLVSPSSVSVAVLAQTRSCR